jgi:hypothetical protein
MRLKDGLKLEDLKKYSLHMDFLLAIKWIWRIERFHLNKEKA